MSTELPRDYGPGTKSSLGHVPTLPTYLLGPVLRNLDIYQQNPRCCSCNGLVDCGPEFKRMILEGEAKGICHRCDPERIRVNDRPDRVDLQKR